MLPLLDIKDNQIASILERQDRKALELVIMSSILIKLQPMYPRSFFIVDYNPVEPIITGTLPWNGVKQQQLWLRRKRYSLGNYSRSAPFAHSALSCSLIAPSVLPLKRLCSLSKTEVVIENLKFGVCIIYIYPGLRTDECLSHPGKGAGPF